MNSESHAPAWMPRFVAAIVAIVVSIPGISAKAGAIAPEVAIPLDSTSSPDHAPARPQPSVAAPAVAAGLCPHELASTLNTIIGQSRFATARWGILIEPLTASTPLYSHEPTHFVIPASNTKLLTTAAALQILATTDPQKLADFAQQLRIVNRDSNNRYADALLRQIGGQHAVRVALSHLGVNPLDYRQVDGSGLSRRNLIKPSALVTLLKAMYMNDPDGLFYDSLAIAGVSGTLRHRFQHSAVQGKVHAKTGTLQGVRALSGYLENTDYGTIAFSIVVNQPRQSGEVLVNTIDQMVLQMARVKRCE